MPDKLNILIKNKPLSILVTGLILLTIFLRFYKLESTAYFVNDQGRDMKVLYNLVYEKKLTLIGPATSFAADYGNIYFGPYYYYFMAIFYLINHSVLFITGIYPFLFIIGAIIFLRVPSFKSIEKVITLIFLIFSWISLYYTRFIWNLNMAFLLSFILFSIFLILEKSIVKSWLWSLLFGIIAGSIFQIHYGMLFLYLGFLVFYRRNKKNILFYLLGLLLSFWPFFVFDIRHNFVIFKNIFSYISHFLKPSVAVELPIKSIFSVFEGFFEQYLLPSLAANYLFKVIISSFIYGSIIFYHLTRKKTINKFIGLIHIIFLFSFFIFKRDFNYYLACLFIWFYLGLGTMLVDIYKKQRIIRMLIIGFFICFLFFNTKKYFGQLTNQLGLKTQENIYKIIKEDLNKNHIDDFLIIVYPHQDDVNGIEYLFLIEGKHKLLSNSLNLYVVCYKACKSLSQGKRLINTVQGVNIYFDRR